MNKDFKYTKAWEKCPYCESEVSVEHPKVLRSRFRCPECGRLIRLCSLCDMDTADCQACTKEDDFIDEREDSELLPLSKQANEVYYQPSIYFDDGTNIGWELPEELYSFDVFESKEDCEEWLERNGYDSKDCDITRYEGMDIEGISVLDVDGSVLRSYSDEY